VGFSHDLSEKLVGNHGELLGIADLMKGFKKDVGRDPEFKIHVIFGFCVAFVI